MSQCFDFNYNATFYAKFKFESFFTSPTRSEGWRHSIKVLYSKRINFIPQYVRTVRSMDVPVKARCLYRPYTQIGAYVFYEEQGQDRVGP